MPRVEKFYKYVVTGTSSFPIDMLRYDDARPFSESDSSTISATLYRAYVSEDRGYQTVTIWGRRPPTAGRWNSFGWVVKDVKEERISA